MTEPAAMSLPETFRHLNVGAGAARLIRAALDEDLGDAGDVTTRSIIEPNRNAAAAIVTREPGVIAGMSLVEDVFRSRAEFDSAAGEVTVTQRVAEGQACPAGETLAELRGPLIALLECERTILNLLGRLCGIATLTRRYVDAIDGTRAVICETRKTTPGLRALEKYAVRCGGGALHRQGLFDAALYKDNHLAHVSIDQWTTALTRAIQQVRREHALRFVEVEVDTIAQLERVLAIEPGLVDIVLLDNMPVEKLRRAVQLRDDRRPGIRLEASGNVNLGTVRTMAEVGVDRISVGALTHSARTLDLGLDIES